MVISKKNCKQTSTNNELFFLFTCVKEGRKYISKLFDSLVNQTKTNFVHYIYEDGSFDSIEDIVLEYKTKAPHLVIYEKNPINIGLNMATKHCIDMCDKPYFIWIDCDNWVDYRFFEFLEKTVLKHPSAILYRTVLQDSHLKSNVFYKKVKKNRFKEDQLKEFLLNTYYYSFFAVNTREYLKINKNNFISNDRSYFNDRQVILPCLLSKMDVVFSRKAKGFYLERSDSESMAFDKREGFNQRVDRYKISLDNIPTLDFEYFYTEVWMINSFWEMNKIKKSNPKEAIKIFFERKSVAKKMNICKSTLYLYGNSFSWFLRIAVLRIKAHT